MKVQLLEEVTAWEFAQRAIVLLGIERLLYCWIYNFPGLFKFVCKRFLLAPVSYFCNGEIWLVAQTLGVLLKPIQIAVVLYDLLVRCTLNMTPFLVVIIGFALVICGQLLVAAVSGALGAKGFYYGRQLGYEIPSCENGFPFDCNLPDP
eukprot:475392-Amphidinium_carterae.1